LRKELRCQRNAAPHGACCRRRVAGLCLAPKWRRPKACFDFFFGGAQKQQAREAPPQASSFRSFGPTNSRRRRPRRAGGSGFLRRSCDGKYFRSLARQCDAGCRVPGFCRKPEKSVLRQHIGRRRRGQRRALYGERKRLSPTARRCARIAPATAATPRGSPGGSHARRFACGPATWSLPQRACRLHWVKVGTASRGNSPRAPIPASPPRSARAVVRDKGRPL